MDTNILKDLKLPKKYKEPKKLVEDCIKLSVWDFPKKLLYALDMNSDGTLVNKLGHFIINKSVYSNEELFVRYEVNLNLDPAEMKIKFTRSPKEAPISQTIKIEQKKARFGPRWYFLVDGRAYNVLYLPQGGLLFGSRHQFGLVYELTRLKKNFGEGFLYAHNRMLNANEKLAKMKRSNFYRGIMTKRTWRILRQYSKYNLQLPKVFQYFADKQMRNFEMDKFKSKDVEKTVA